MSATISDERMARIQRNQVRFQRWTNGLPLLAPRDRILEIIVYYSRGLGAKEPDILVLSRISGVEVNRILRRLKEEGRIELRFVGEKGRKEPAWRLTEVPQPAAETT